MNNYETFGYEVRFERDGNHGGVVCGKQNHVQCWLDDYFKLYAPAGYDTKITSDVLEGDVRIVRVFRGSSCD